MINTKYLLGPKKIVLLFPETQVTRKIFTRAASIYIYIFLSIFQRCFLFFFGFFCFFWFLCFFLFVCCFLKLKMYILIHIWLCGWVSDKNFSPGQFPETRLLFFGLVDQKLNLHKYYFAQWVNTGLK